MEEADKYIQQYFHDVSMSEEYLGLPCTELLSIVRRDELHVFSEEQVSITEFFHTELKWFQSNVLSLRPKVFPV